MKVNFTYVRHGETLFNQVRRMQGACDSPLSEEGVSQAENTASALRNKHFDHIFCSSSERAWDTAKIVARYQDTEPVPMKELKEFDFGTLDGEMIPALEHIIQPHRIADDWTDVGGENCELFRERAERAFSRILPECEDGDEVLIVSHGSFFSHLMKTMFTDCDQKEYIERRKRLGLPFVPNCSISEFSYEDGNYRLISEPLEAEEYRRLQNKKITFHFVRHGETVFNAQWRMQGWCDAPLTENGIRQAEERRETLRNVPFSTAYVSTTERTRDTAAILLEPHQITPVYDKRLREVFFGTYEGERIADHEDVLSRCFASMNFTEAGGENKKDIFSRLKKFFTEAVDEAEDGDQILLVSHGGLYLCAVEMLTGLTMRDLEKIAAGKNPTPNLGYAVFLYENGTFSLKKAMSEE